MNKLYTIKFKDKLYIISHLKTIIYSYALRGFAISCYRISENVLSKHNIYTAQP